MLSCKFDLNCSTLKVRASRAEGMKHALEAFTSESELQIGQRLLTLTRSQELQERTRREKLAKMQSKEMKALETKARIQQEHLMIR